jgi:hypothetical protein
MRGREQKLKRLYKKSALHVEWYSLSYLRKIPGSLASIKDAKSNSRNQTVTEDATSIRSLPLAVLHRRTICVLVLNVGLCHKC